MNNTADYSNCIIQVIKKSRSKFMQPSKGMILYTVYNYINSWGTEKLICIDMEGNEYQTTLKSVRFVRGENSIKFDSYYALKNWIKKTHIPIIFKPVASSRNNESVKCAIISSSIKKDHDVWMSKRLIKNEDGTQYEKLKMNSYQSAFVPLWYTNKIGLIRTANNNY